MAFDLAAHLGAMEREVQDLEYEGQPAKAIIATRVYDTSPADLWDALTRPDRIKRWFAPVTGDLRQGGRYQVEGNASGTILECRTDEKVALTWEFGGSVSWVNITLTEGEEGTLLELEHIAPLNPHYDTYGPGAVGVGWDLAFMGLARHLAEPYAEVAAEAVAGWGETQEAKDMMRTTSAGWGQAAIEAGEDRDRAFRAAEATRRFYSGEPPLEA